MPTGYDAQLLGMRFGRLTVISMLKKHGKKPKRWVCECDCGGRAIVNSYGLMTRGTKSCGCLMKEAISSAKAHGLARRGRKSNLYLVWCAIRQRCYNPRCKAYKNYGGRGITLDPNWNDYATFAKDVGERPHPSLSLDRIDNDGNYEPGNIRWATRAVQSQNRRKTINPA